MRTPSGSHHQVMNQYLFFLSNKCFHFILVTSLATQKKLLRKTGQYSSNIIKFLMTSDATSCREPALTGGLDLISISPFQPLQFCERQKLGLFPKQCFCLE